MEFWGNFEGETLPRVVFVIWVIILSTLPFAIVVGIMFLPQLIKDDEIRAKAIPAAAPLLVVLVALLNQVSCPGGSGPWLPNG